MTTPAPEKNLARFAWLSIAAALVTIGLKSGAWWLTGSVGLLSDALESLVNLAAAIIALVALTIAARPADEDHDYGHEKAEYFSSGIEGGLILAAALAIVWSALPRLLHPAPLEQVGLGLAISVLASLVNLAVSRVLLAAAKRHDSIALEADAHHLMTDVWTSGGVLLGVGLVVLTGWQRLDPIVAILVALNIVFTGVSLIRRSAAALLDPALPPEEQALILAVLGRYRDQHGMTWHALRTRQAGPRRFVAVHVLVPGDWTVKRGHDLADALEQDLAATIPGLHATTHLEPSDDPLAHEDVSLHRPPP